MLFLKFKHFWELTLFRLLTTTFTANDVITSFYVMLLLQAFLIFCRNCSITRENITAGKMMLPINPFNAYPTKWSNTPNKLFECFLPFFRFAFIFCAVYSNKGVTNPTEMGSFWCLVSTESHTCLNKLAAENCRFV